jgi:hypothetical protein
MTADELQKKLEKVSKQSEQWMQDLSSSAQQLRAICFGQDRYWRRYWSLPRAGGIFLEGIESAEPEMFSDGGEDDPEETSVEDPPADTAVEVIDNEEDEIKEEKEEQKENETENKDESEDMQVEESAAEKIVENGLKEEKDETNDVEMKDESLPAPEKLKSEVEAELTPLKTEATPKKEEPEEMDEDELENGEKFNPMSHLMRWGSPGLYNGVKDLNGSYNSKLDTSASSAYSGMASPGNVSFGEKPWFSIIPRESCDENSLTKPPYRESGIGLALPKGSVDIRIPWFPRPQTSASPLPAASPAPSSRPSLCDSPPPMSIEEAALHIEQLRKLGETVESTPRPLPRGNLIYFILICTI